MRNLYSPETIVASGLCIGCGNCSPSMIFDKYGQYKPDPEDESFSKVSAFFSSICPFSPVGKNEDDLSKSFFSCVLKSNASIGRYISNYAGFVAEDDFRVQGSSGGMVTWVAAELLKRNLVNGVAHVVPSEDPQKEGRFFKYTVSHSVDELRRGAKSRYYPVEFSQILKEISSGTGKIAFVAVPCMIKAIQLRRFADPVFREKVVFTLGLFCGHMKSACFTESFAWQMNVPVEKLRYIDFRNKLSDRPANWYNTKLVLDDGKSESRDWWKIKDGDWGAGFFMNEACNWCDDVVAETADASFGDAWVEPYSSDGKGTNVVVIRSEPISRIVSEGISSGSLKLEEVTPELVEKTQAAGLRQRRQGLAYRLTRIKKGVKPLKRVAPDDHIPRDRKKIYRMRNRISEKSHRIFLFSKKTGLRWLYLFWARWVNSIYYGTAYHKGSIKSMWKRFRQLGQVS